MSGIPLIVDADTVYVSGRKIRLAGIDAPETDQICVDQSGRSATCGIEAKDKLIEHSAGRSWTCRLTGVDRYGRSLGTCSIAGEDVSTWLVRNGWALAFRRYSLAYAADETHARQRKKGLWSGAFVAPWDWRQRNAKTTILGAFEVPADAQRKLITRTVGAAPPTVGCVIKGNMGRAQQCIYHLPGGRFYDRLKMEPTASRRWFCSEADAEAAGCRRSQL